MPSRLAAGSVFAGRERDYRDQRILRFRLGGPRARGELAVERGDEALHLPLHLRHLLPHVENDLDAREVHTELARQMQDDLQSLEIAVSIEPRVAFAARRTQQS